MHQSMSYLASLSPNTTVTDTRIALDWEDIVTDLLERRFSVERVRSQERFVDSSMMLLKLMLKVRIVHFDADVTAETQIE